MFDELEFNRICTENRKVMISTASRMLGPSRNRDAEDVVQDALLLAWKHRNTFREQASLKTWLHRILLNTIYSHPRHKDPIIVNSVLLSENHDAPHPAQSALETVITKDIVERVLSIVDTRTKSALDVWSNGAPFLRRGDKVAACRGRQELHRVAVRLGIATCPVIKANDDPIPIKWIVVKEVKRLSSKCLKPCSGPCTTLYPCAVCSHRASDRKAKAKSRLKVVCA